MRQKEPGGLGHAVWCARKFIGDEPFAVLLGDDVIDSRVPSCSRCWRYTSGAAARCRACRR